MKLFPFQETGINFLATTHNPILADDMGLGKTIQTVKTFEKYFKPEDKATVLIVCPKVVQNSWQEVIKQELDSKYITCCTILCGSHEEKQVQFDQFKLIDIMLTQGINICIVNYEGLSWLIDIKKGNTWFKKAVPWTGLKLQYDLVIFDEIHKLKNRDAAVTKAAKFVTSQTTQIVGLSGTPIMNRTQEIWSILNVLYPKQDTAPFEANETTSFWAFAHKYCNVEKTPYGMTVSDITDVDDPRLQLLRNKLNKIMLRREKLGVLPELPTKIIQQLWVNLEGEQLRMYQRMQEEMLVDLPLSKDLLVAPVVLAQIIRLKQIAVTANQLEKPGTKIEGAKISALYELLESLDNKQVVIFSQFAEVIRRLGRVIPNSVVLTGDATPEETEYAIDTFKRGGCQYFLGSLKKCYQGINGLQVADTCIFLDKDWVPAINEQAQDRLNRIGQKNSVQIIEILAKDSVEEAIERLLQDKQMTIENIIGRLRRTF